MGIKDTGKLYEEVQVHETKFFLRIPSRAELEKVKALSMKKGDEAPTNEELAVVCVMTVARDEDSVEQTTPVLNEEESRIWVLKASAFESMPAHMTELASTAMCLCGVGGITNAILMGKAGQQLGSTE